MFKCKWGKQLFNYIIFLLVFQQSHTQKKLKVSKSHEMAKKRKNLLNNNTKIKKPATVTRFSTTNTPDACIISLYSYTVQLHIYIWMDTFYNSLSLCVCVCLSILFQILYYTNIFYVFFCSIFMCIELLLQLV